MSSDSPFDKGADFVVDLGAAIKRNPIPAALIGMGVVWMLAGGRTSERAERWARRRGIDRLPDAARDTFGSAYDGVRSGLSAIGDRVESASDTVRHTADATNRHIARSVSDYGERVSDVREQLADLFEAQPLMLGAIGIAIGAGLAAALPRTEVEAEYLGAASDEFRSQASNYVSEQAAYASDVAREMASTAAKEAERQGLSIEGAKDAAGDVADKVARVVDTANESIADRAR